jgi:ribosome biogenesis protein Nip4
MTITVQRGTPAEEKKRRRELRKQITSLNMKFMLSDEDVEFIDVLQEEYYALLVLADSEHTALTITERKHMQIFAKTIGTQRATADV